MKIAASAPAIAFPAAAEAASEAATPAHARGVTARVYRYTSQQDAAVEVASGMAVSRHVTGLGEGSRMLKAKRAGKRYGIASRRAPGHRSATHLPGAVRSGPVHDAATLRSSRGRRTPGGR